MQYVTAGCRLAVSAEKSRHHAAGYCQYSAYLLAFCELQLAHRSQSFLSPHATFGCDWSIKILFRVKLSMFSIHLVFYCVSLVMDVYCVCYRVTDCDTVLTTGYGRTDKNHSQQDPPPPQTSYYRTPPTKPPNFKRPTKKVDCTDKCC